MTRWKIASWFWYRALRRTTWPHDHFEAVARRFVLQRALQTALYILYAPLILLGILSIILEALAKWFEDYAGPFVGKWTGYAWLQGKLDAYTEATGERCRGLHENYPRGYWENGDKRSRWVENEPYAK